MTTGRPDYETRKAARIARLEARAARTRAEAESRYQAAKAIADRIPMGQPILVGHHSEQHARRDVKRIQDGMTKACELNQQAKQLDRRAKAAESNRAISSDDPTALEQLRAKLAAEKALLARYQDARKAYRKATDDRARAVILLGVGLPMHFTGDGWPGYATTNLSGNIRRIAQRIEALEKQAAAPTPEPATVETTAGEIEIRTEDNRTQILFPGKPSAAVRSELKASGFRWAPSAGAWQRMASNGAQYQAERIVAAIAAGTLA
jgi:hypothetical protein